MKFYITIILLLVSTCSNAQEEYFMDWQELQLKDRRLRIKYGSLEHTKEEKRQDKIFIKNCLKTFSNKKIASEFFVEQGFKYLKDGNFKSAMYRFNQAHLLNPKNSDIYWGYGEVLEFFNEYTRAKLIYSEGLAINPENENILLKYGEVNILNFEDLNRYDKRKASKALDLALKNLNKAISIDTENPTINYNLALCHLYNNDCENSNKYFAKAKEMGIDKIPNEIQLIIKNSCVQSDRCNEVKTGTFKVKNSVVGDISITRTEEFQIEEYHKHGVIIRMNITWIDDCTYGLELVEVVKNTNNIDLPREVSINKIYKVTDTEYSQITNLERRHSKTEIILDRIK